MLAAEAIYRHLKTGESLASYEEAVDQSSIGKELYQVRNTRQAFQKGFVAGSLLAGPAIMSRGKVPPGRQAWPMARSSSSSSTPSSPAPRTSAATGSPSRPRPSRCSWSWRCC